MVTLGSFVFTNDCSIGSLALFGFGRPSNTFPLLSSGETSFTSQADDLSGPGLLSAQCTIRVSNIRNGIRRVTFRNERDNKDQPMAIVLVDIQVLSLEDINDRIAKCKRDIKVGLVKLAICFYPLTHRKLFTMRSCRS